MTTDTDDEGPSKSARKRAAHAAQDLGERLITLREADLAKLPLPEDVKDAVREARTIRKGPGQARQRQFIGKLMRNVDAEPVIAVLEGLHSTSAADADRDKRVERWRKRLLTGGPEALDALEKAHPSVDRAATERLIHAAHALTTSEAARTLANRELFRALRALLTTPSG